MFGFNGRRHRRQARAGVVGGLSVGDASVAYVRALGVGRVVGLYARWRRRVVVVGYGRRASTSGRRVTSRVGCGGRRASGCCWAGVVVGLLLRCCVVGRCCCRLLSSASSSGLYVIVVVVDGCYVVVVVEASLSVRMLLSVVRRYTVGLSSSSVRRRRLSSSSGGLRLVVVCASLRTGVSVDVIVSAFARQRASAVRRWRL